MLTATCARIAPHPLWYSGNCSWGRWKLVLARGWCPQWLWVVGRPGLVVRGSGQWGGLDRGLVLRSGTCPMRPSSGTDEWRSSQNGGEGASRKSISGTTRDAWLNETSFPLQILRLSPCRKTGIESSSEDPNACSGCSRPQSWHWAPLL